MPFISAPVPSTDFAFFFDPQAARNSTVANATSTSVTFKRDKRMAIITHLRLDFNVGATIGTVPIIRQLETEPAAGRDKTLRPVGE